MVAKVLRLQLQHQSFQWIFRVALLHDCLVWSFCSLRDSQDSSPAPQLKSISASVLNLLYNPSFTSYMTTWKTIALMTWTFAGKVMSQIFNMLSQFLIASLPRSKCLLISWLKSLSSGILESKKRKSVTVSTFSLLLAMKWWHWMPWYSFFKCCILSQLFPLSSFTLIKRLFRSSSLSAIRVLSSKQMQF